MRGSRLTWAAVLATAVLFLGASAGEARQQHRSDGGGQPAAQAGRFDYYLLSFSIAPSFCVLTGAAEGKRQCASPSDLAYHETPLTVHGLWPNRAGVGLRGQPRQCDTMKLPPLSPSLQADLAHVMPGAAEGLDRYEWQKHGTCSGLSPEAYFAATVAAARKMDATIGEVIRQRDWFGREVAVRDLLDAVARANPALANAIIVDCKMARKTRGGTEAQRAYISEIRVLLGKSFPQAAASGNWPPDSFVPVSEVGRYANSGCPKGAGYLPESYARN